MTMALPTSERQHEGEGEARRADERQHGRSTPPSRRRSRRWRGAARACVMAVVWRDQFHSICPDWPVKPRPQRQEAERATVAERDAIGDARAEAAPVDRQRRVAVGVVGLVHRVRVMGLVVPGDPQARRQREGQKAEPADEVAQPARAHDGAVQGLVADEGGAGEAVADDQADERRRPPAAEAEVEGGDAADDDGVVEGKPREARSHGMEHVRRQRRADLTGVRRKGSQGHVTIVGSQVSWDRHGSTIVSHR